MQRELQHRSLNECCRKIPSSDLKHTLHESLRLRDSFSRKCLGPKIATIGRIAPLGDPAPSSVTPEATWLVFLLFSFCDPPSGDLDGTFCHPCGNETDAAMCLHTRGLWGGIRDRGACPRQVMSLDYTSETLDRPSRGARPQPRPVFPSSRLLYGVWHRDGTLSGRWFQGNRVFEVGPIVDGRRRRRAT